MNRSGGTDWFAGGAAVGTHDHSAGRRTVLITGGQRNPGEPSAEIFDPADGTSIAVEDTGTIRSAAASVTAGGKVLSVGGYGDGLQSPLDTMEVWLTSPATTDMAPRGNDV